MKIAYITHATIPGQSAAALNIEQMCRAFAKEQHEVTLIAPWKLWRRSSWRGVNGFIEFSSLLSVERIFDFPFVRRSVFDVFAAKRALRLGVDIAHCRKLSTVEAACGIGLPCILELHSMYDVARSPEASRRIFADDMLRRVIVITDALKRDMLSFLGVPGIEKKIHVVRDAVDTDKMQAALAEDISSPGIGYFGTVSLAKGCGNLLELARHLPNVYIHLVGRIDRSMARKLSHWTPPNLLVYGCVPHARCLSLMKSMQALILPNPEVMIMEKGDDIGRYTSPMKMFEYMATGVPIIASRVPAILEVLDENCAVLVDADDTSAWCDAARQLLHSEEVSSRLASNALGRAAQFGFRARVGRVLEGLA
ncbi:glycosyltransferase [Thermomonas brevis]